MHPNSVHVRSFCGWVFHYLGDSLRAIEQFEEARRLNPVDPKSYFPMLGLAAAHFFAGHFDDTVSLTGRILVEVPTHNVARRYRAAALAHLGRIDEAKAVIVDLLKAQPNSNLRSARSTSFQTRGWPSSTFQDLKRPACQSDCVADVQRFVDCFKTVACSGRE